MWAHTGPLRSQISYEAEASLLPAQYDWAVLFMCLFSIVTKYNGPLEVSHVHIDYDRYDIVECGATGQLTHTRYLRSGTRLKQRFYPRNPTGQCQCACLVSALSVMGH